MATTWQWYELYTHLPDHVMSGRRREQYVLFQRFLGLEYFPNAKQRERFTHIVHFLGSLIKIQAKVQLKGTRGQGNQGHSHAFASLAGSSKTGSRQEQLAKALRSF